MVEFIHTENSGSIKLSYSAVAREFLESPISEEDRGLIVNMMVYLDFLDRKKGLKFVKLNSAEWEGLQQATTLQEADSKREVA